MFCKHGFISVLNDQAKDAKNTTTKNKCLKSVIYRYLFIFWCIVKSKEPRFWHFCLLNMNQDTDAEFTHFIFNKKRKKNSIWWVTTAYGGSWMGCTGPSGLQVKQSSYKKQNKTTKNVQLVEFKRTWRTKFWSSPWSTTRSKQIPTVFLSTRQ